MADPLALHQFLRGEFDGEAQTGFARLSRVPDTHVRHFLDYYRSLDAANQDALADASTLWGAHRLLSRPPALEKNAAWQRWLNEIATGKGRDPHWYLSVPLLRALSAEVKIRRGKSRPSSVWDKEMEAYAATIRSVKAADMRKLVAAAFRSTLNARASNRGGGDWAYEGTHNGARVTVSIDYGGHYAQLRYSVAVESTNPPVAFTRAGLEAVLGAGHGDWDFIVEDNVQDAITLLGEIVAYVAELPARLPEGCLGLIAG